MPHAVGSRLVDFFFIVPTQSQRFVVCSTRQFCEYGLQCIVVKFVKAIDGCRVVLYSLSFIVTMFYISVKEASLGRNCVAVDRVEHLQSHLDMLFWPLFYFNEIFWMCWSRLFWRGGHLLPSCNGER